MNSLYGIITTFQPQSNRQRVASGNSYCCTLITRHPVGTESMADSVSEVS